VFPCPHMLVKVPASPEGLAASRDGAFEGPLICVGTDMAHQVGVLWILCRGNQARGRRKQT